MKRVSKARFMEHKLRLREAELSIKKEDVEELIEEKKTVEGVLDEYKISNSLLEENVDLLTRELEATTRFPIILRDGIIFNAIRVDRKPFYFSRWRIVAGSISGDLVNFTITRLDDETVYGIVDSLQKINFLKDIIVLCQREDVFYD